MNNSQMEQNDWFLTHNTCILMTLSTTTSLEKMMDTLLVGLEIKSNTATSGGGVVEHVDSTSNRITPIM